MRLTPTKLRKIRGRLEAHRFALLERYRAELERADEQIATLAAEPVESATEKWDARVLAAMSDMDAHALESVIAAIHRIDSGRYGTCAACGESIDAKRLDALPEAPACRACMTETEKMTPRSIRSAAMGR